MIALAYLNRELKELLTTLAWNAFLPNGPTGLTFEVFLAALCEAHSEQMSRQFQNPDRIKELIQKYKPWPLKRVRPDELEALIRERAAATGFQLPSEASGRVPAFSVKMQPCLAAVFEKAVQLAQEEGLDSAGIPQFVQAMSSERKLVNKLFAETGLMLRTNERR